MVQEKRQQGLLHNCTFWLMHWICHLKLSLWKILYQVWVVKDHYNEHNLHISWRLHIIFLIISRLYFSFWFEAVEKTGSDALKSSMVIPPPTVLDRVLKDLFHEGIHFLILSSYWLLFQCDSCFLTIATSHSAFMSLLRALLQYSSIADYSYITICRGGISGSY